MWKRKGYLDVFKSGLENSRVLFEKRVEKVEIFL